MNQKLMLYEFLAKQEEPQTLDQIMEFIDSKKPIPRSTIRARLSELRKRGIKIDNQIKMIEKKEEGWIAKDAS